MAFLAAAAVGAPELAQIAALGTGASVAAAREFTHRDRLASEQSKNRFLFLYEADRELARGTKWAVRTGLLLLPFFCQTHPQLLGEPQVLDAARPDHQGVELCGRTPFSEPGGFRLRFPSELPSDGRG